MNGRWFIPAQVTLTDSARSVGIRLISAFGMSGIEPTALPANSKMGETINLTIQYQITREKDATKQYRLAHEVAHSTEQLRRQQAVDALNQVQQINLMGIAFRERTAEETQWGFRFIHTPESKALLEKWVELDGVSLVEEQRSAPRLPVDKAITTFPVRAELLPLTNIGPKLPCKVRNLSHTGILLETNSVGTELMNPGEDLNIRLENRGWFPIALDLKVKLVRLTEDTDEGGTPLYRLGLSFQPVPELQQSAFHELMSTLC